jgi:hypothetical protein
MFQVWSGKCIGHMEIDENKNVSTLQTTHNNQNLW